MSCVGELMAKESTIPVASTLSKLIDMVLAPDGSIFFECEFFIKINLEDMGKDGHLIEECPTEPPKKVREWKNDDKALLSRIINYIIKNNFINEAM